MANPTADDLLNAPDVNGAFNGEVVPQLQQAQVPVTSWFAGDVLRAIAFAVAYLWSEGRKLLAAYVAATFEDYAFGFTPAPFGIDVTGWAPFLAKQRYGIDQIGLQPTRRAFLLTNTSGSVYGPLTAGGVTAQFTASGRRYILDEDAQQPSEGPITIPAQVGSTPGTVSAIFRAEEPGGAGNGDSPNSTIALITATFPGVTATNPAGTYTNVGHNGTGSGSLALTGSPTGSHSVAVRIDALGQSGVASWSTSLDGGAWTSHGAAASITNLGGFGLNIALTNGAASPSFAKGDIYFYATPGTDIVTTGRDAETPQQLGTRCRGLIPLFAAAKDVHGNWIPVSPTNSGYAALAATASDQVATVLVQTSATTNNQVDIIVAGQGVPLPSDALAAVQGYLDAFSMLTDLPVVQSAATTPITLGGAVTVSVRVGQLSSAQQAMQSALADYFVGVDPSDLLGPNGLIERDYLVALVRTTPGVTKTNAAEVLTINGSATDLQLPVDPGTFEIALWTGQDVATLFTWSTSP